MRVVRHTRGHCPAFQPEVLDERNRWRCLVITIRDDQLENIELQLSVNGLVDYLRREFESIRNQLPVKGLDHLEHDSRIGWCRYLNVVHCNLRRDEVIDELRLDAPDRRLPAL